MYAMRRVVVCRAATARAPRARWLSGAAGGELEDEANLFDTMEKPEVPAGWALEGEAGSGFFRMKSTTEGQDVVIDVEVKAHDANSDSTGFTALITRNGITGDFSLRWQGGELSIEGMTTYRDRATAVDLTVDAEYKRVHHYAGPAVEDLEGTDLVPKAHEFLDDHGVNAALGEFVNKHVQVTEQREYMAFLKDIKAMAA